MLVSLLCIQGYSQCFDQLHTPYFEDGWLSCQKQDNPNPDHPVSHWILYDLGWEYTLDSTYIWNYNSWGINDRGMKDVIIDYSSDGTNWTSLGTFEFEMASGSIRYEGTKGPDFGGIMTRYVLITANSNWGNEACTGLSEIKFHLGERTTSTDPELEIARIEIKVTPNPVMNKAEVSVLSEKIPERVALYDLSGKLMDIKTNLQSSNIVFDLSGMPIGIYVVKAWLEEGIASAKIAKVGF
jgi:hypothetical protein